MSEVANWLEFEVSKNEYLLVEVEVLQEGILFSFDSNGKDIFFDESIKQFSKNRFMFPLGGLSAEEGVEALSDAIISGYLIPNGLNYAN